MNKPIDQMNNEERTKFFEENLAPLIRYGYQSAIDEIIEFISDHEMQPPIMDKLMDMMNNKKQVDWKKLQAEKFEIGEFKQLDKPVVSGSCAHEEVISVRFAYKCKSCGQLIEASA